MTDEWNLQDAALGIPCAYCDVAIDQPCRTTSGKPTNAHSLRFWPLARAYGVGYSRGRTDERAIAEQRQAARS